MERSVISLKRRPDRWDKFLKEVDKSKLYSFIKYDAVDGNLEKEYIKNLFKGWSISWRNYSFGEGGCAISHLNLWQRCIITNKPIIVFEDDVKFCDSFEKVLKEVLQEINERDKDWGIIWLAWHTGKFLPDSSTSLTVRLCPKDLHSTSYHSLYTNMDTYTLYKEYKITGWFGAGTAAYIISPKAAYILYQNIKTYGFVTPVDDAMMNYCDIFSQYACIPRIAWSPLFDPLNPNCIIDSDVQLIL